MKIKSHSESHIDELDDGTKWQIFPGDLDVTLNWKPDTELKLVRIEDRQESHFLQLIDHEPAEHAGFAPEGHSSRCNSEPGKPTRGETKLHSAALHTTFRSA